MVVISGFAIALRLLEEVVVLVVAAPVDRFTRLVVVVVVAGVRLPVLPEAEPAAAGVRLPEVEPAAAGVRLPVLLEVEPVAAGVRLPVLPEVEPAAAGVRLLDG